MRVTLAPIGEACAGFQTLRVHVWGTRRDSSAKPTVTRKVLRIKTDTVSPFAVEIPGDDTESFDFVNVRVFGGVRAECGREGFVRVASAALRVGSEETVHGLLHVYVSTVSTGSPTFRARLDLEETERSRRSIDVEEMLTACSNACWAIKRAAPGFGRVPVRARADAPPWASGMHADAMILPADGRVASVPLGAFVRPPDWLRVGASAQLSAMHAACAFAGVTEESFVEACAASRVGITAQVVSSFLSLLPCCVPYIKDTVRTSDGEDRATNYYAPALRARSGDCEDMAMLIVHTAQVVAGDAFAPASPSIAKLRDLVRRLVPCIAVCATRRVIDYEPVPRRSFASKRLRADAGCHAVAVLLSPGMIRRLVARHAPGDSHRGAFPDLPAESPWAEKVGSVLCEGIRFAKWRTHARPGDDDGTVSPPTRIPYDAKQPYACQPVEELHSTPTAESFFYLDVGCIIGDFGRISAGDAGRCTDMRVCSREEGGRLTCEWQAFFAEEEQATLCPCAPRTPAAEERVRNAIDLFAEPPASTRGHRHALLEHIHGLLPPIAAVPTAAAEERDHARVERAVRAASEHCGRETRALHVQLTRDFGVTLVCPLGEHA